MTIHLQRLDLKRLHSSSSAGSWPCLGWETDLLHHELADFRDELPHSMAQAAGWVHGKGLAVEQAEVSFELVGETVMHICRKVIS